MRTHLSIFKHKYKIHKQRLDQQYSSKYKQTQDQSPGAIPLTISITTKLREMGEMKQNYILHTFGFFMICDNKQ